ncbi:hypothetical protein PVL29_018416 [Vitis rotundifolia]|uniref:Uncharacterized protein n=1 Tax=Vitis rotundifolia TaxID=103349 RepID=A0AA38Z572_VITRO|nr:hypothetical protein PVL29_018416 [Vitis rotundifolia]
MGYPPKSLRNGPWGDVKRLGVPRDGPNSTATAFSLPLEPTGSDPDPDPGPGPIPFKEGPCKRSSPVFFKPNETSARPEEDGPTDRQSTGNRVFDPTRIRPPVQSLSPPSTCSGVPSAVRDSVSVLAISFSSTR